jgi:hypothetical protein
MKRTEKTSLYSTNSTSFPHQGRNDWGIFHYIIVVVVLVELMFGF